MLIGQQTRINGLLARFQDRRKEKKARTFFPSWLLIELSNMLQPVAYVQEELILYLALVLSLLELLH